MAANIGRTKWPTRLEGMKRDGCRDGSVRECESVCYERATTGLQENPSTRSAPWRLGHPTIGPSGDTSGGMDFDSISIEWNRPIANRLGSTLAPLFTLVHQATDDSFRLNKEKGFVRKPELEGEPVDDSKRLISPVENPCTFIYICIHFRSVSFRL